MNLNVIYIAGYIFCISWCLFLFFNKLATINIGKLNENDWIIGNIKSSGFYRINYDSKNWDLLINQLNDARGFGLIDVSNRAQLLDDAFNLGRAEIIDQLTFLKLARYLKNENNAIPFMAVDRGIRYINRILSFNSTLNNLVGV